MLNQFYKQLIDNGLAVMPGDGFNAPKHVRITLQTDMDVMNKAISIFNQTVTDIL